TAEVQLSVFRSAPPLPHLPRWRWWTTPHLAPEGRRRGSEPPLERSSETRFGIVAGALGDLCNRGRARPQHLGRPAHSAARDICNGASPTSILNRVANAVRDIPTCRARLPTSQRACGWRRIDTIAAATRGSRRAGPSPTLAAPGAEKYVRSTSMNNRSARRLTATSAPG